MEARRRECSGRRQGLRATEKGAKGSRGSRCAHLGPRLSREGAQRRRRRSSAAAMAWWSRTGLTRGRSGLLGSTGSFREFLPGSHGSQGGRGTTGGGESLRRRGSPVAMSGRNPGAGRGATSELRLPGAPRGLGDAAARLAVDRGVAGRRGRGRAGALRGGARRAGGARVRAAPAGWDGGAGVRRGWLKGVEAEILGEEGGMGGPRGLRPVISGRRGRCAEEGDDLQVGQGSQRLKAGDALASAGACWAARC